MPIAIFRPVEGFADLSEPKLLFGILLSFELLQYVIVILLSKARRSKAARKGLRAAGGKIT